MDVFALDEVWLVSLVAAAGTGWIAGKWKEPPDASEILPSIGLPSFGEATETDRERPMTEQPSLAGCAVPRSRELAQALDAMPPVETVRAQAEAIRREANLWNTPGLARHLRRIVLLRDADPIGVMAQYRAAIESLEVLDHPSQLERTADREPVMRSTSTECELQPSSSTRV